MSVVRHRGRGGRDVLHIDLSELEDRRRDPLRLGRAAAAGHRDDRHFELDGQKFTALNGGPEFTFSEAISFQVSCESQDEVDAYWSKLSEGGEEGPCGWLKDRFGVSWQIVPTRLCELIRDPTKRRRSV